MILADTSVAVAAFASWHVGHASALAALKGGAQLPLQAAIETYSVLTRLPPPHRADAYIVQEYIATRFPDPFVALPPGEVRKLMAVAAGMSISGGAFYDALIGATAARANALLLTRDQRASRTYQAVGASFEYVS